MYLFGEVPDCVVVRVGEEVSESIHISRVLFQMIHESRAVSAHLMIGCDCTESDLAESGRHVRTVCDPTHDRTVFDDHHRFVCLVEDQPYNVLLRHIGQLAGEYVLQTDQPGHDRPESVGSGPAWGT